MVGVVSPTTLLSLLPQATLVTCTCTKSVTAWRTWLLSGSDTFEVAWMKVQLWKYLSDAVGPLFSDCRQVEANLADFKTIHRTES